MNWVRPFGFIVAGLVGLAFFLPWARLESDTLIGNMGSLVQKIVSDDQDSFVEEWVWMREREWKVMWHSPGEGLSGYQLMMTLREEDISSQLARAWMSMMFGSEEAKVGVNLLVLAPIFAIATAVGLLFVGVPKFYFAANGLGCLIYYILLRWKLNASLGERMILHVELSYGLWLTLYGILLLALVCVLKMVLRD